MVAGKDTSYVIGEEGKIAPLTEAQEKKAEIPQTQANADNVNFYLNKLDYYQNQLFKEVLNLLSYAGIPPSAVTETQVRQAIQYIVDNTIATTTTKGINYIDKYWIWGFKAESGAIPSEQVTITPGKAICQDGSTIVELVSTAINVDYPTLNGGVLANNTTYHLFRYLKDDDTMQWHLSTSLTPTIPNIKSALAYRRILSLKTNGIADLPEFDSVKIGGGLKILLGAPITDWNAVVGSTSRVLVPLSVPSGFSVEAEYTVQWDAGAVRYGWFLSPLQNDVVPANDYYNMFISSVTLDIQQSFRTITDTSGRISMRATASTIDTHINTTAYTDFRNYF